MSNKAILMSIRPQYVVQILKGVKTIEVRKKFPKDYVGWVYIYCTKSKLSYAKYHYLNNSIIDDTFARRLGLKKEIINGKVVARFWCDKVEMIRFEEYILNHNPISHYFTASVNEDDFIKKCGMYNHEEYLDNYLGKKTDNGYAIHISKLEVFEKLKELKEFKHWVEVWVYCGMDCPPYVDNELRPVYTAPQNWCYIEE